MAAVSSMCRCCSEWPSDCRRRPNRSPLTSQASWPWSIAFSAGMIPPPPMPEPPPAARPQHRAADSPDLLSRQLRPSGYVLDVRPKRPPPAERPGAASARAPLPCVVLLSRSSDAELAAVGGLLRTVGVPTARINADELAATDLLIDPGR